MKNEKQLIAGLLARDEGAYRQAVRMYHPGLLRLARSIVGEAFADEVVQETWVAVIRGLSGFEGRSSFKTWIFGILTNIARSRLRRESRSVNIDDSRDRDSEALMDSRFDADGHWSVPPVPWHEETPEALLSSDDLRECLEKIMSQLPAAQRQLLSMRDIEGLAMDAICNVLDISDTNGRVLLHRARVRLRAAVERHARGEKC